MPNIKAAEKWVKQSEKRRVRNTDAKTRLKTLFKKAKTQGEPGAVEVAESALDRAAVKGIIHPNKAARKKSRLAKAVRVNAARAAAAADTPVKKATKAKPAAKKSAKTR